MRFTYRRRSDEEWEKRLNQRDDDEPEPKETGGDSAAAVAFLEGWRPGGPWLLSAIEPDGPIETCEFSRPSSVRRWIDGWNGTRNLYYAVNRTRPGLTKKAAKSDVTQYVGPHVDLDPPKDCGDLAMAQAALLDRLKGYDPPPSGVVFSGGGYQGLWLLAEPEPITGPQDVARLEAVNRGIEKALGGDHCHNVDRILRLPGTINLPDQKKREAGRVPALAEVVYFDPNRRYRLDEFEFAAAAADAPKEGRGSKQTSAEPRDYDNGSASPDLDDELAEIIRLGHDPQDSQRWGSRSEGVFFVVCALIREFWSDMRIAELLRDKSNGISAHIYDQSDPQRAVRRVLERAHEELAKEAKEAKEAAARRSGAARRPATGAWAASPPGGAARRRWPVLAEAALYGLPGRIVRGLAPHTEADPAGLLFDLLAGAGNVIGRRPYWEVEADRHHANIYVGIVGGTAERKDTAWGYIRRLIGLYDSDWVKECLYTGAVGSGEGIIHRLRDRPDEFAGSGEKRLLIHMSELSILLKLMERPNNITSGILRDAWDGREVLCPPLIKTGSERATGAHVSMVGHTTEEELTRYLTATEIANGLANRILFVLVRRCNVLPFGGMLERGEFSALAQQLFNAIRRASQFVGEVKMDAEARELWEARYEGISAGRPGLLGAVTGRGAPQTRRLALIYGLLDDSRVTRKVHLAAALAAWNYAYASAEYIFGDATGDPVADTVLAALQRAGSDGLTRWQINELLARNYSSARISAALIQLARLERARSQNVASGRRGGRPTETWYFVK
jgi:hypothetical protein